MYTYACAGMALSFCLSVFLSVSVSACFDVGGQGVVDKQVERQKEGDYKEIDVSILIKLKVLTIFV